jgi:hypothetical protein
MNGFIDQLVSSGRSAATEGIKRFRVRNLSGDQLTSVISGALHALDGAHHLSSTEKRWRLTMLCRGQVLTPSQVSSIVTASPGLSPGMRLAFVGLLPEALRQSAYRANIAAEVGPARELVPIEQSVETDTVTRSASAFGQALEVVVLGTTDQDATVNLLRESNFSPLVIRTPADLDQLLQGDLDICGFIVDGSFWAKLDAPGQRAVVGTIAKYSSFPWLRIDTTNLHLNEPEVANLVRAATADHQQVVVNRLQLQPGNQLKRSQMAWLDASRDSLTPDSTYGIAPGEIDVDELRLLQCALRAALSPRISSVSQIQISPVRASFLSGGRTSAKVAKILFGSTLQPVVAKVDSKELVLQEAARFNCFIRPWDENLDPKVFVHGKNGVIVFGLVADRVHPDGAAPMLEKRLEQLWSQDLWRSFAAQESAEQLRDTMSVGLGSAVEKLGRLNRRHDTSSQFPNYASPDLTGVKHLEAKGRSWGFNELFLSARDLAEAQFKLLASHAVVHGDIHVRNVLLRDDREAFFIDYASAGPGHPCTDLIRLDLSTFFSGFRPLADERQLAELQCDLSVHGFEKDALARKYPDLLSFPSNALYSDCAIRCRKEALDVLAQHHGALADYLASKYLFAWTSLQIASLPAALCRAVIEGIGPHIA